MNQSFLLQGRASFQPAFALFIAPPPQKKSRSVLRLTFYNSLAAHKWHSQTLNQSFPDKCCVFIDPNFFWGGGGSNQAWGKSCGPCSACWNDKCTLLLRRQSEQISFLPLAPIMYSERGKEENLSAFCWVGKGKEGEEQSRSPSKCYSVTQILLHQKRRK